MKTKRIHLRLFFLMTLLFLLPFIQPNTVSAASTVSYKIKGTVDYTKSFACLNEINTLRKREGLTPLKMDQRLLKYAVQRCAEITAAFSHTRPNGSNMISLNRSLIYGENIASGYSTAELTFNAWQHSPGHYQNMTRADYKSAGLACFDYNGKCYWVNLFSKKAAKAVTRTGTAKITIQLKANKKVRKTFKINVYSSGGSNIDTYSIVAE